MTTEQAEKTGEILVGTCDDIYTAIATVYGQGVELVDLSIGDLYALDEVTMMCDACGWWCPAEDFHGDDQICCDCREDD